jgi:hypothetical protein
MEMCRDSLSGLDIAAQIIEEDRLFLYSFEYVSVMRNFTNYEVIFMDKEQITRAVVGKKLPET